jgi:hypothetical protein
MPEQTKAPREDLQEGQQYLGWGSNNGTLKRPNIYRRCSPHLEANWY